MTLDVYKLIAALLIFLVSIVTVAYPLRKKDTLKHPESMELGEALASGIFLGAALFHMLPDAIRLFEHAFGAPLLYPIPEAICAGGFLLLLFLERLSLTHTGCTSHQSVPYVLALILIIHSITEGAALGIGATMPETTMIFIAILAHKGSESFALCMMLCRQQLPTRQIVIIIFVYALMTPVGIGLGAALNVMTLAHAGIIAAAIFNAFAAGTFLYISTLHHIHFHQHQKDTRGLIEFGFLAAGVTMMGIISLWT